MVSLHLRVSKPVYAALQDLADEEADTVSHVMRRAALHYLKEHGRDVGRDNDSLARAHEGSGPGF